ncbi:MAG: ribosome biogenesis factor YjgA [Aquisalimonadaceae bacterium]
MDFDDDDEVDPGPSRSERKREAEALQKLGNALIALSADQLHAIPLETDLREAIDLARRLTARGGRRRQLQLVGKLMRSADVEAIRAALEQLDSRGKQEAVRQKQAEGWRERLLAEGDVAVAAFLTAHPDTDVQRLRQLIQNARREQAAGKPPRSARELFRHIRAALEQ